MCARLDVIAYSDPELAALRDQVFLYRQAVAVGEVFQTGTVPREIVKIEFMGIVYFTRVRFRGAAEVILGKIRDPLEFRYLIDAEAYVRGIPGFRSKGACNGIDFAMVEGHGAVEPIGCVLVVPEAVFPDGKAARPHPKGRKHLCVSEGPGPV